MSVSRAPHNTNASSTSTPIAPDHLCIVINLILFYVFDVDTEHCRVPKEMERPIRTELNCVCVCVNDVWSVRPISIYSFLAFCGIWFVWLWLLNDLNLVRHPTCNKLLPKRSKDHMVASRRSQLVYRLMHLMVGTVMGRSYLRARVCARQIPGKSTNELE